MEKGKNGNKNIGKINTNIKGNEINIIIEANSKNKETEKIFDYIANYKQTRL